jgi:hypothetical protein
LYNLKNFKGEYKLTKKLNKWKITSFVLIIVLIAFYTTSGNGISFASGNGIAEDAVNFINVNLLQGQATAILGDVTTESGLYKAAITIEGQPSDLYISKDGKLLFPTVIPLTETIEDITTPAQQQDVAEITIKSDKPVVEVFVMSHCPYGTQMEKGILPVAKLLDDKIDFNLKFVYYAMHGEKEVTEQLNQYCIQKEQNDKFMDYLYCFLEDGEGETCLSEIGIDIDMMNTCTEAADTEFEITKNLEDQSLWLSGKFPLFNTDKEANEKYSVGGSPTLVINGETAKAGRDSVSLLNVICSAFNEVPEECGTEFEAVAPGPGFGWSSTGSNNVAQCG